MFSGKNIQRDKNLQFAGILGAAYKISGITVVLPKQLKVKFTETNLDIEFSHEIVESKTKYQLLKFNHQQVLGKLRWLIANLPESWREAGAVERIEVYPFRASTKDGYSNGKTIRFFGASNLSLRDFFHEYAHSMAFYKNQGQKQSIDQKILNQIKEKNLNDLTDLSPPNIVGDFAAYYPSKRYIEEIPNTPRDPSPYGAEINLAERFAEDSTGVFFPLITSPPNAVIKPEQRAYLSPLFPETFTNWQDLRKFNTYIYRRVHDQGHIINNKTSISYCLGQFFLTNNSRLIFPDQLIGNLKSEQ